ncbi:uncharacterized protein LOC120936885 [Rana temporaria]|uniref:uncharacterized protein LOC120936885 n=1 Tax=Rana temporaria TaxID=8407 RepID=UPI001AAD84BD|nr:uncharacterized protein LOC120936885 [Rana temporaria]
MITWDQVLPYPAYFFSSSQASTYQAVLVTDGIYSFCLMYFADGGMNWNYLSIPSNYLPKMGYFSGESSYYSPAANFPAYNDPQTSYDASIQKRYTPDQYIGRNTNKKGYWAYRLEYNSGYTTNYRMQCLNWYYNEIYSNVFPYWMYYSRPCPCTYWQAVFDSSYREANILPYYGIPQKYTDWYSQSYTFQTAFSTWFGGGTRCYYSYWGSLTYGEKERYLPTPWEYENSWLRWNDPYYYYNWYYSYYLSQMQTIRQQYQEHEVDPYNNCCLYSGSSHLCSLYRQRRPYDFCVGYVPPSFGSIFGDPHINTLDDVQYTFNGLGEFTLANVRDENNTLIFTLQGRTAMAGNDTQATNFVGLAAMIPNQTTVEWLLQDRNTTVVKINGTAFTLPDNSTQLDKLTLETTEKNEIMATFDGGISVTVSAKVGALSFTTMLDVIYKNKTEGLLGVFNDDKTDDLMASNGTKLEFDGVKLPNESIIFEIGMTWKTTPLNSIFYYNETEGESWYTYNNNSFVPLFYDKLLLTSDPAFIIRANETCKGNDECIFDILSTKSFEVGESTLDSVIAAEEQSNTMNSFPPNVTGPTTLQTKLFESVTVFYTATDNNNETVVFSLQTDSSDINITENGMLVWLPTSSFPVNVSVIANNSKTATSVVLTLVLCNCTNNGSCLYDSQLSLGNETTTFLVAGCNCSAAWTGMYCEENFDACKQNQCFDNSTCEDKKAPDTGFECGTCPPGLTGDGETCTAINECYLNISTCQQICNNNVDGYNCSCDEGYEVNSLNSSLCDDIDECANFTSPCGINANCTNSIGNYSCKCLPGYEGDATWLCVDINECAMNKSKCPEQSLCINTNGSYQCDCLPGFDGANCSDINECSANSTICPLNSNCNNTIGSFVCTCNVGFGGENCTDIDECTLGTNNCNWADCVNTVGSYNCICRTGYTDDGVECIDINECQTNASICGAHASCNNTIGSYDCHCDDGFSLVNGTCKDVDECSSPEYCKGAGRSCINTEGSYNCSCQQGYQSVNESCADIDECISSEFNNCSEHAICTNVAGSFLCECMANYTGNGVICTAINMTTEAPTTPQANNTTAGYTGTPSGNESSVTTLVPVTNASSVTTGVNETIQSPGPTPPVNQTTTTTPVPETNTTLVTPVNVTVQGTSATRPTNQTVITTEAPVTHISTPDVNSTVQSQSTTMLPTNQTTVSTPVPEVNTTLVTSTVNVTSPIIPLTVQTQSTTIQPTTQTKVTTSVPGTNTTSVTSGVTVTVHDTTVPTNQTTTTTAAVQSPSSTTHTSQTTDTSVTPLSTNSTSVSSTTGSTTTTAKAITTTSTQTTSSTTTTTARTAATTTVPTTSESAPAAVDLFDYGLSVGDFAYVSRRTDFTSPLFQPLIGFPFGNQIRNFIYYTDNGQIIFPSSRNNIFSYPNPPVNGFSTGCTPASIAVFWNDADFSKNVGTTYYQEYNSRNIAVVERVEGFIKNYTKTSYAAQWTLKITWENAPAYPATQNDVKTSTYQAVLTTDGFVSYVLMLYKDGGMNWDLTTRYLKPLMGYCSGNGESFFNNTIINSNSDLQGLKLYLLNSTLLDNSRMNCLNWYNAQPSPSSWNSGLLSCPCLYSQGISDFRFRTTRAGGSSTISLLRSTSPNRFNAGIRCVYYRKNQFLEGFQEKAWISASSMSSMSDPELDAFDTCCNGVDDPQFCSMYMQKRFPINCRNYRPLVPGWMFGDPHITTLDGLSYTFNGLGDFTLLDASAENITFILQGRTVRTGTAQATNFAAFAVNYTSSSDSVTVEWYLESNGSISTLINGQHVSFTYSEDMDAEINGNTPNVFLLKNDSITATFEGILSVSVSEYSGMFSAVSSLPDQFLGKTKGLLGTWNNDQSDDFMRPNGTTIPSDSSEQDIYHYGLLWEAKLNNLFTYVKIFERSVFIPIFYKDLIAQNSTQYKELQTLCGNNTECIFDAMSTNQKELGLATLRVSDTLQAINETLNAEPPQIIGDTTILTFMNTDITVTYTSNVTGVTFSADPNTNVDIFLLSTGSLTWKPTSTAGFTFNLVATDSKNLSSALQLNFVVCNCNLSAQCNYTLATKINNSSLAIAGCICTNNYTGEFCQNPPNPCIQGCYPNVTCDNTTGCGPCPSGFSGDGIHCTDIDECSAGTNACDQNANCSNIIGNYTCTCREGFNGNGFTCTDIDECQVINSCSPNANCTNTPGSYSCSCKDGFTGNGFTCTDIDECQVINSCSANANCTNTPGSYSCSCKDGFTGNGFTCTDIDECQVINSCSPNANCTNTPGSYSCSCKDGFTGDGLICNDIDECQGNNSCSANATCTNTPGSYSCSCKDGLTGNGVTCTDIDECQGINPCSQNANCTNTPGSYSCSCKDGFTGDGVTCTDIDECQGSNSCSANANCTNTPGSYSCSCKDGFTGNGTVCICSACDSNYCSNGGTCTRIPPSCNPVCQCLDAYTGEKCTVTRDRYPAQLNPGTRKRSVYVTFTHNENFLEEQGYNKIRTVLTNAPIDVDSVFDDKSNTMEIPMNISNITWTANFTARFTYIANITVIDFLNVELEDYIKKNNQTSKRSTALTIADVISGDNLTVSELAQNFTCVSGFVLDPTTLQCYSKCNSYCMNDGTCNLIEGNATCTCNPFTIYVTSGERCENLSMNLNAFFGILFGALAFLFLLILGIVLGIYIYRKRKSNNGHDDTDQLFQTRFSWKSSLFPSFQRFGDKDTASLNTDTSSDFIDWKPHLDKVNSKAEVKIKRPEIKPNLSLYE